MGLADFRVVGSLDATSGAMTTEGTSQESIAVEGIEAKGELLCGDHLLLYFPNVAWLYR
jgi:hypothetical protein